MRDAVDRIRGDCPDLWISSHLIVGFPTEMEREFRDTVRLARESGISRSQIYIFSPIAGTPAAAMRQKPRGVGRRRGHELLARTRRFVL